MFTFLLLQLFGLLDFTTFFPPMVSTVLLSSHLKKATTEKEPHMQTSQHYLVYKARPLFEPSKAIGGSELLEKECCVCQAPAQPYRGTASNSVWGDRWCCCRLTLACLELTASLSRRGANCWIVSIGIYAGYNGEGEGLVCNMACKYVSIKQNSNWYCIIIH